MKRGHGEGLSWWSEWWVDTVYMTVVASGRAKQWILERTKLVSGEAGLGVVNTSGENEPRRTDGRGDCRWCSAANVR